MRLYKHIVTKERVVFRTREFDMETAIYVRMSKQEWLDRGSPSSIEYDEEDQQ